MWNWQGCSITLIEKLELTPPGELGGPAELGDAGVWLKMLSSSPSTGEVASTFTVEKVRTASMLSLPSK